MTFWTENWQSRPPSVWVTNISGRPCVVYKEKKNFPTTIFFPRDPVDLPEVLGHAIDVYNSAVTGAVSPESQEAKEELLKLTTSIKSLPDQSA